MNELNGVDRWFVDIAAMGLFGYFLFSMKGILGDLKESISELKDLVGKLFEKDNNHESRISAIEGRCAAMPHCEHPGGRRPYDPAERIIP